MHWMPPVAPNSSMVQALLCCAHQGVEGFTRPETAHTVFHWQLAASGARHGTPLLIPLSQQLPFKVLQMTCDYLQTWLAHFMIARDAVQVMGIHTGAELRLQALPDLCTRFGARVGHLLHNASRGLVGLGLAVLGVVACWGMTAWRLVRWLLTAVGARHLPDHTLANLLLVAPALQCSG